MAKYSGYANVRAWKQHTCLTCGSVFRYKVERSRTFRAADPDAARQGAHDLAIKAIAAACESRPCPRCGLYQPEMIGAKRRTKYFWLLVLTAAWAILFTILCEAHSFQYDTLCWLAMLAGVINFLVQYQAVAGNANRNMAANRIVAENLIEEGRLELVESGWGRIRKSVPLSVAGMGTARVFLIVALALFPLAEVKRRVSGWRYNEDWYPPVAGPGDVSRYYFSKKVESMRGYWRGTASAKPDNTANLGLGEHDEFYATTKSEIWSNRIYSAEVEDYISTTIFADIVFPRNPKLEGATVTLKLAVTGELPMMLRHAEHFTVETVQVQKGRRFSCALDGELSGREYEALWWGGIMLGFFLQFIAALVLFHKAKAQLNGLPTVIEPIEDQLEPA